MNKEIELLKAENARLKRECQSMGRLIQASVCIPTKEYQELHAISLEMLEALDYIAAEFSRKDVWLEDRCLPEIIQKAKLKFNK